MLPPPFLVPQPHVARQARPVDEHLAAVAALLWLLLVLSLLVPVEIAPRPKYLPAVAEELLDRQVADVVSGRRSNSKSDDALSPLLYLTYSREFRRLRYQSS